MEKRASDLLNRIPGYTGYRSKEDRRDDDRRLRESIAGNLDATVSTLTRVSAALAEQRKLMHISAIERLVGATRLLADRVRTASYGYGGIFSDRSIDEFALDQLRHFDDAFQKQAASLGDLANQIANSPEGPLDTDITAYQTELNRIGSVFDARGDVVENARPSRDAAVLSLLEPVAPEAVSPLVSLKVGDALAIEGDNFMVDATVSFATANQQVMLARIGEDRNGKVTWLLAASGGDIASARLTEAKPAASTEAAGQPARAAVTTGGDTRNDVSAEFAYTAPTDSAVSFRYSIGGETRNFSGSAIEDSDVEVYGQA